ncbi:NlpC/P60 family protein [Listeria kieliensis]
MKKAFLIKGILIFSLVGMGVFLLVGLFGGSVLLSMDDEETATTAGGCSAVGEVSVNQFNQALEKAGVFKGKGEVFLRLAHEQGIDPVLFASIAMSETGWGSSKAVQTKNNPGGLMDSSGGVLQSFSSIEDGLASMSRTLHNRIIKDGLNTIEKLGAVYAPVGASNDPLNLNSNWIPTVYSIAEKFGGLTANCSDGVGKDIHITGEKISYFDAVLREAKKYEGWPYSWGGNHPESGFDCSGLVQWTFKTAGVTVPRTAIQQYGATQRISANEVKAGDLIFFKGTYGGPNHISHVGIVVNQTTMFDSNSSGIGYHNFQSGYWKAHFAGFGRVKF